MSRPPRRAARGYLAELRAFCDAFLKKSPTGRRLIDLYYAHSPEIAAILLHDARLRSDLWHCIRDNRLLIRNAGSAGLIRLNKEQQAEITALLKRLQAKSGNDLKNAIGEVLERIATGELLGTIRK